jgi:hypothetical protein
MRTCCGVHSNFVMRALIRKAREQSAGRVGAGIDPQRPNQRPGALRVKVELVK